MLDNTIGSSNLLCKYLSVTVFSPLSSFLSDSEGDKLRLCFHATKCQTGEQDGGGLQEEKKQQIDNMTSSRVS